MESESAASEGAESTFQLIKRFRSGDQQALELLFSRHLPRLQRWAKGRLPKWARGNADTQDLVQETLLQTFTRMDVFGTRISFTAGYPDRELWVYETFLPQAALPLTSSAPQPETAREAPAAPARRTP